MEVIKGQKIKLATLTDSHQIDVSLNISSSANLIFDMSCFGLDSNGRCTDDRYFIFYNQHNSPCGGIRISAKKINGSETFALNLGVLPARINKLVFTASIDGDGVMSQIQQGQLSLHSGQQNLAQFHFQAADFQHEKAIIVAEFYYKDEWRFSPVGQGFNDGLRALLAHFGIEEESEEEAVPDLPKAPVSNSLNQFRALLSASVSDGELTESAKAALKQHCRDSGLLLHEALKRSSRQIENFLRRLLADIIADGIVTAEEEARLEQACGFLQPRKKLRKEINGVIVRFKKIGDIRAGEIEPLEPVGLVTRADEMLWHEDPQALLLKITKQRTYKNKGTLYVTSERIVFKSRDYPAEIMLRNIIDIESHQNRLSIIGKNRGLNFDFQVSDGLLLEAYVEQAINRFHRKLDLKPATGARVIPQSVKQAVWLRDQGRCVECGAAEQLEFDHIIPYSKGGSNTENNLQLLCRGCNQNKADSL